MHRFFLEIRRTRRQEHEGPATEGLSKSLTNQELKVPPPWTAKTEPSKPMRHGEESVDGVACPSTKSLQLFFDFAGLKRNVVCGILNFQGCG